MSNIWITAPGFVAVASFTALWCYKRFPFFRKLCIPQALLAGFFLLLCGPEIFSFLPVENYSAWKTWPGYLISFLFAGIILGDPGISSKKIANAEQDRQNNFKKVLQQSIFVWFIALSQLAIGFLVVSIFSLHSPIHPLIAHIIEIGWIGGHGSAAAFVAVCEKLNAREIGDLALFSATSGLFLGSVVGIILVNRMKKKEMHDKAIPINEFQIEMRKSLKSIESESSAEENLEMIPFVAIALLVTAVFFAYLIRTSLQNLTVLIKSDPGITAFIAEFPLFSLALLAALFIRFIGKKTLLLNNEIISEIRKFTAIILDILILSAVATLKLTVFQQFLFPFLAITSAAILWCSVLFIFFARRMLPTRIWKELGILNFGMSTGVTALGLMLLKSFRRQIDPEVARLYAMAAPFSAPLIGGGAISLLLPELTARGHSTAIMSVLIFASALLYIAGRYLNRKTDY